MILLCDALCFSVGSDDILKDVTFSLEEGDRLGIVGVNGAGKSTLLRMICGETAPVSGNVHLKKGAKIAMLKQNDAVGSDLTPYEEMLTAFDALIKAEERLKVLQEEMQKGSVQAEREYHVLHEKFISEGGYEYKSRAKGVLKSLGFDSAGEKTCASLSGGEKTRLALAKILLADADILLLDEPTNHLDLKTLSWLEDYLRSFRKTLLVVSHDRYFLDRITNKTLDIEHGQAKLYNGSYSVFIEKKKKDREIAERHYKNQQREIKRIEEYIALQHKWNRERNIIAAESRQKMLDRMERVEKPKEEEQSIRLSFSAGFESGEDVLTVKGLTKGFGGKKLFSDLSFEVHKKDRLFIIGHNGCGKSTLMKLLMQRLSPDAGVCAYGYNLTIGYYDQENLNLTPSNTVLDELWNFDPTMTQTKVRSALALFRFTKDEVEKKVSVLSGGERARLTFSKLVLRENNLLLLDEPTNHLDIASKEVLEGALKDYDGTLVCVSHDRYFISKLANAILDFDGPDGRPVYFKGSYGQYLSFCERQRSAQQEESAEEKSISENKRNYLENKRNQAELRKQRARLERAKKEADEAEARLSAISEEESENASDYLILSELSAEKESLETKLLELLEEIEDLENKLKDM